MTVPASDLMGVVQAELARLEWTESDLWRALSDRHGYSVDYYRKAVRRAEVEGTVPLELADRVLVALDLTLDDLPTPPVAPRRRGDGAPAVGATGFLTEAQVLVCHRLYLTGLSLREVAERILPRTPYTSVDRCAESLRRRFVRMGLERRGRGEHQVTHGRARRSNNRAYINEWRRTHGVRPAVRCGATKANGEPCGSWAVHDTTRCNKHRRVEAKS